MHWEVSPYLSRRDTSSIFIINSCFFLVTQPSKTALKLLLLPLAAFLLSLLVLLFVGSQPEFRIWCYSFKVWSQLKKLSRNPDRHVVQYNSVSCSIEEDICWNTLTDIKLYFLIKQIYCLLIWIIISNYGFAFLDEKIMHYYLLLNLLIYFSN